MIKVTGHRIGAALTIAVLLGSRVGAEEITFDFKDPKGVNSVAFYLDSTLEPIVGIARGISGKVRFDPDNPGGVTGRIVIDAREVKCALPGMTKVLHGEDWLDVKRFPTIEFSFKKVENAASRKDKSALLLVRGELKCKGVTKEVSMPVTATYLPGRMGDRMRGAKGDLLVLRVNFAIKRKDFDIKPKMGGDVVAENIELRASVVGWAKRK